MAQRCQAYLDLDLVSLTDAWSVRKRYILYRDATRLPRYAQMLVEAIAAHYGEVRPALVPTTQSD